jgi:hypothetical protein
MLGYALVLLIAGGVGWGVYWLTLRWGIRTEPAVPADVGEWKGTDPSPDPFVEAPPGGAYLPVAAGQPSWQSRLSGVLGLVIAVAVAAVGSAFALYTVGRLIARMLQASATG